MIQADVVLGLNYGDESKGKCTHHLLKTGDYTHCIRTGGGQNAGHTIYHEGKKFVTHGIPAGVFFGVRSIIGPECLINVKGLLEEIAEIEAGGVDVKEHLRIDYRTHIVTDDHIAEEIRESRIGTTKKGIGPASRDKYARIGVRALEVPELKCYITDVYKEFYEQNTPVKILCEGSQAWGLDITWGDYPYVTSSHCSTAGALLCGIPHTAINRVWGVAKAYETYVGEKQFEDKSNPLFAKIRDVGNEYGATTGRPRQCNFLNLSMLKRATKVNGVTDLVISKMDVLQQVGRWGIRNDENVVASFETESAFVEVLKAHLPGIEIYFSYSPEKI